MKRTRGTLAALAALFAGLLAPCACRRAESPPPEAEVAGPVPGSTPAPATLEPAPAHTVPVVPPPPAPAVPSAGETALPTDPRVVAVDPPNRSKDVDPARTTLSVTFDRPMDAQGWAWVVEQPVTAPRIGDARWDATFRTNTAQVALEPGRDYVVWVNSPQYSYFRDRSGTAATPFRWTFTTKGERAPVNPGSAAPHTGPPTVVSFVPPNGATDVDPSITELRATFDRKMGDGWSWVTEAVETFPEMTGKGGYEPDGATAVLPVRLKPGRDYVVWLNSQRYQGFRDAAGVPLPPVRWTFSTRGGASPGDGR